MSFRIRLCVCIYLYRVFFPSISPLRISRLTGLYCRIILRLLFNLREVLRVCSSGGIYARFFYGICKVIVSWSSISRRLSIRKCKDGGAQGKRAKTSNCERRSIVRCRFLTASGILNCADGQCKWFTRVSKIIMFFNGFPWRTSGIASFSSATASAILKLFGGEGKRSVTQFLFPHGRIRYFYDFLIA